MIGSHIEYGCQLNTSNYRTISIVNYYRCRGYECLPELSSCWCPSDVQNQAWEFAGNAELFPWYDSNDPASTEYLGKMVMKADGLDSSTLSRSIIESIGGSYSEAVRSNARELVFDGLMFALTARGLEYGKRWEAEQLWNGFCSCCDRTVKIRSFCDTELWELQKFVPVSGPKFDRFYPNGHGCFSNVARFEFVAKTLDPYIYTAVSEVVRSCFNCDGVCETWECPTEQHYCGPECCSVCLSDSFSDLFDVGTDDCCYCRPLVVSREVFELPSFTVGRGGLNIKLFSGSETFANGRALIVEARDASVFDDPDVWSRVRVVDSVEFAPIPKGVTVTVDSKKNSVTASCGGSALWASDAGGLPFSGLFYGQSCNKLFVVFEADFYTVADDAEFQVSVFRKF